MLSFCAVDAVTSLQECAFILLNKPLSATLKRQFIEFGKESSFLIIIGFIRLELFLITDLCKRLCIADGLGLFNNMIRDLTSIFCFASFCFVEKTVLKATYPMLNFVIFYTKFVKTYP